MSAETAGQLVDRCGNPERLLDDLTRMIRIPSVNPFDQAPSPHCREDEFAAHLLSLMKSIGLETGFHYPVAGRPNVWGRLAGQGTGPTVMLAGHLDTVGVDGYDNPFSGEVIDQKVYGRGACDMKGAFACFVEVARILQSSGIKLSGDVLLVGISDEEHMMLGSRYYSTHGPQADVAIIGEPSRLAICPAHSGQNTFFIRTFGTAAHSSRPENGVNAIAAMGRVIHALQNYGDDLKSATAHPLCGHGRFSPGVIRGGTISSAVPDFCELEVDRRFLPGETSEQIQAELRSRIEPLKDGDPSFRYEIAGPGLNVAPLDTPIDSPLVKALAAAYTAVMGEAAPIVAFPGGTDAPYLGCPTVICGPGDLKQAHTLNEFVETQQLDGAVRIYLGAILNMMSVS